MGEDRPGRRLARGALSAAPPPLRPDGQPWVNFHGRRRGKRLRPNRAELLQDRLAALSPPGALHAANPTRRPVDPAAWFDGAADIWLEIGFGGGEHLAATAARRPDVGFIGCEPFMNGVAAFLALHDAAGLRNVRVHAEDARFLLEVLPPASLGRVYLLYPDPWPKRRHRPRRFFNQPNLDLLAPRLRPGAELRLATDVPDYVRHARAVAAARADLAPVSDGPTPWPHWPGTRYEAKARREGRTPHYLRWRRS